MGLLGYWVMSLLGYGVLGYEVMAPWEHKALTLNNEQSSQQTNARTLWLKRRPFACDVPEDLPPPLRASTRTGTADAQLQV